MSRRGPSYCAPDRRLARCSQLLRRRGFVVCGLGAAVLAIGWASRPPGAGEDQLAAADKLFGDRHWAEARTKYEELLTKTDDWCGTEARRAVQGSVECSLYLQLWDDALERAADYVERTGGTFYEAVGERLLGSLYLRVPHHGTRRGDQYLRGQWTQGVQVSSWRKDQRAAVRHYERARELLFTLMEKVAAAGGEEEPAGAPTRVTHGDLVNECIGVDFDLAGGVARPQSYYGYRGWWSWWWEGAEAEESQAADDAEYEEPYYGYYGGYPSDAAPIGIPLGPDGEPQFVPTPESYDAKLPAGQKIRFLLAEVQRLDESENRDDAALALYRSAMIARSLYGPEALAQWRAAQVRYDEYGRPLPTEPDEQAPQKELWELGDDEALTIAGGILRVVQLPPGESPVALLNRLEELYPRAEIVPEAMYARGLYFQTRQQFPRALAEYAKLRERFPQHQRSSDSLVQEHQIRRPEVMPGQTGVYLPDRPIELAFSYRNTARIQFRAVPVDLFRYVQDRLEKHREQWWSYRNLQWSFFQDEHHDWKRYIDEPAIEWSQPVERLDDHRAADGRTTAPLTEFGAYVIEARPAEAESVSRALVLVTDIAIVQKNLPGRGLIYVADASSGQPLARKAVRLYEHWSEHKSNRSHLRWETNVHTTNENGVIEYARKRQDNGSQVEAIVAGENGRMAFSFFQNWYDYDPGEWVRNGTRDYVLTDRPVYRPRDTVHFRVWLRELNHGKYAAPSPKQDVHVQIYDARNNQAATIKLEADEFGGATGEFKLGEEPPLGVYRIQINGNWAGGGVFRVEEYKKPEFVVTVKPAATTARLGEKIKARIDARYYFGAPVAEGELTYKVFREDYRHVYFEAGEYDWLYGPGYGYCYYPYPWFPWWGRWGWLTPYGWPYPGWWGGREDHRGPSDMSRQAWQPTPRALRELVAQGNTSLSADGTAEIEIDTSKAATELPDRDHRYTIEVEVRDSSRRTIEGRGSVLVTRQEFYAFVTLNNGWYQPQNEVLATVRTVTPDNVAVAAEGQVEVYRIRFGGADRSQVQEEEVAWWNAATDENGRLSLRYQPPGEGQYRLVFRTLDGSGAEVLGNALCWVIGPAFDGRIYRFNDLEIIADRRTYAVGDTAHLLLNVARENARVLFSDDVLNRVLRSYRFIDVPGRSCVIDVPISERHVPNFHVEATLVREGRVHTEVRELFVPPVEGLLNVTIGTDRKEYRPGQEGKVIVSVTDWRWEPVRGQVTLTAFDEAITYIQEEFGPDPRTFFHGERRHHVPAVDTSLNMLFSPHGTFVRPEVLVGQGGEPQAWRGWWWQEQDMLLGGGAGLRRGGRGGATYDMAAAPAASQAGMIQENLETLGYGVQGELGREFKSKRELSGEQPSPSAELVTPALRTDFADTAVWCPALKLDDGGRAVARIRFPQSLTTWRLRASGLTERTQVGDARVTVITNKDLIVRLQAPRFFVERDEVVLSANVHNYLATEKDVTAELLIPGDLLEPLNGEDAPPPDQDGYVRLTAHAEVEADAEHRFDWPVRVRQAGLARITARALTDEESDAMQLAFPVLIHGVNKTVSASGAFRVADSGQREIELDLPEEIDPEQTRLEIVLAPSLAGVMIDALPYLAGYPYGCVEQTMSRFYPSVLVRDTLRRLGTDLEAIGRQRRQLRGDEIAQKSERLPLSPVFDSAELDRMVQAGLQRLYAFQNSDGGWGWWREDGSSPFQTAYVLQGLRAARDAGIAVDGGVLDRGVRFLEAAVVAELNKPTDERQIGGWQEQAYLAYILAREGQLGSEEQQRWLSHMFEKRESLNHYGHILLALAMHHAGRGDEARTLLRNVLQFVARDDENETAWVRTQQRCWWYWWNSDIETNAWTLRALVLLDPQNDLAPRIVKWLVNNRRNGYYWNSTRDTAQVIAALTDYMVTSGESEPDYAVSVLIDGQEVCAQRVTTQNQWTFDNRMARYGLQVRPGPQTITISKDGRGALYYSCYLSYFTKEEDVEAAGDEIRIERKYYRLVPRTETVAVPDARSVRTLPAGRGTPADAPGHAELRQWYERVPLTTGDTVTSGEQIEVVLTIEAKNTYDFLAFEDHKAAGCEPVDVRSGTRWAGGLCANVELRDEKVVFFVGLLEQGRHVLKYTLRAEIPGRFHALPTSGFAMYAPEIRAISDEMRVGITD